MISQRRELTALHTIRQLYIRIRLLHTPAIVSLLFTSLHSHLHVSSSLLQALLNARHLNREDALGGVVDLMVRESWGLG